MIFKKFMKEQMDTDRNNKNSVMKSPKQFSPRAVLIFFCCTGFILFTWAVLTIASVVVDDGNNLSRAIISLSAFPAILFLVLVLSFGLSRSLAERFLGWLFLRPSRPRLVFAVSGALLIIDILFLLVPSARLGEFSNYYIQVRPAFMSATVASVLAVLISLSMLNVAWRDVLFASLQANRPVIYIAAGIFAFALGIWAIIAIVGWGIHAEEDYWFGAGTPVLFQQVLIGIFTCIAFAWFERRRLSLKNHSSGFHKYFDLFVFMSVWLVTAILWAMVPAPSGFTTPRPMPPNYELYPFADAARFDTSSQFALIGQDLNNGHIYYRILYMGYLFLLHLLFGQDFERLMFVQAILFAIFPSLVYLLGRNLWNRTLGIGAAAIVMFSGLNSILAGAIADLAHPKQMLTDFPIAIALAGFLVLTTSWIKQQEKISTIFWAAGLLGMSSLVRPSMLGLLPLLILLIWMLSARIWKVRLILSGIVIVLAFSSALPWSIWSTRPITDVYSTKIMAVITKRYLGKQRVVPKDNNNNNNNEAEPSRPRTQVIVRSSAVQAVPQHFLHGLTTSTLVMPPSILFYDLEDVIREAFPYWDIRWDGKLDLLSMAMILFNLGILSIGIAFAFRTSALAGIFPLLTHLYYTGINSLGRTSGGRYSAPVDWIFLFYFVWGCLAIFKWFFPNSFVPHPKSEKPIINTSTGDPGVFRDSLIKGIPPLLVFVSIGAVMILIASLVPKRYDSQSDEIILQPLVREEYYRKFPGLNAEILDEFLKKNRSIFWVGRALYPRYYLAAQGLGISGIYAPAGYPRLIFTFITPHGLSNVILPGAMPKRFPNAADVYVLGCRVDNETIEALAVTVVADVPITYTVPANIAFDCPLRLK